MNTGAARATTDIQLDEQSIDPAELSMAALKREISLKRRPNGLLVSMMNALEKKRQGKGYGWSRAWNKYGLNVFRSHTADMLEDGEYVAPVQPFLENVLPQLEEPYGAFASDLLSDPKSMVFTFYHNNHSDGEQYEGLTLSFGRKVVADPTKRDRLDIILEDRRVDGAVDGEVDRVRIYVCPWESYADKNFHLEELTDFDPEVKASVQELYEHAVSHYHLWKDDEERQWSHWSTRYIDYFGARDFIPQGSCFT